MWRNTPLRKKQLQPGSFFDVYSIAKLEKDTDIEKRLEARLRLALGNLAQQRDGAKIEENEGKKERMRWMDGWIIETLSLCVPSEEEIITIMVSGYGYV